MSRASEKLILAPKEAMAKGKKNRMPNTAIGRPTHRKSSRHWWFQLFRTEALITALSKDREMPKMVRYTTVNIPDTSNSTTELIRAISDRIIVVV